MKLDQCYLPICPRAHQATRRIQNQGKGRDKAKERSPLVKIHIISRILYNSK